MNRAINHHSKLLFKGQVIYLFSTPHKSQIQILRLSFLVLDSSPLPQQPRSLPSLAGFYPLEGLCATSKLPSCPHLPLCHTQPWSSFSPDPKSQFPPSSTTTWSFLNYVKKKVLLIGESSKLHLFSSYPFTVCLEMLDGAKYQYQKRKYFTLQSLKPCYTIQDLPLPP